MLVRRCCNCDRLMGVRLCRASGTSHGLCPRCGWHLYGIPDEARPWWRELLALAVALLAIGPLVVWVVGCDSRECIRSHKESRIVSAPVVGNVMVPIYGDVDVCDEYEPSPPEAKP